MSNMNQIRMIVRPKPRIVGPEDDEAFNREWKKLSFWKKFLWHMEFLEFDYDLQKFVR